MFGNYSGECLKVGTEQFDIKNNMLTFDPKIKHEVTPFTGKRYTLTFFTHKADDI